MDTFDARLRLRAFDWLREQTDLLGDVLPRQRLQEGFVFEGERVPLVAPQGIFTPRRLQVPLTITTSPNSPYDDTITENGLLYRYRGTDPRHRDNTGLRRAMEEGTPLVYLHGLAVGRYLAVWPVYIVGDDPATLTFRVQADDPATVAASPSTDRVAEGEQPAYAAAVDAPGAAALPVEAEARRGYVTALVRRRLHQGTFREWVLKAYRERCAVCRLRHNPLLDAAHIIPDRDPRGRPAITNGLALCKLHHAAYDAALLGITPDYAVQIRPDILRESDGPLLLHGLQELHGQRILLPRETALHPDRDALDVRYQRFREGRG